MKPNMGNTDRAIRAVLGIAAIAAWPLGILEGGFAIAGLVVGIVLLTTAAIRWCPPYAIFGINTGARRD